jgi:hypothetical protein
MVTQLPYLASSLTPIPVRDRSTITYSKLIGVVPGSILNLLITADTVPLVTISPNFMPATDTKWRLRAVGGQNQLTYSAPCGVCLKLNVLYCAGN